MLKDPVVGLVLSGLIGLVIWAGAYYGFFNFALPSRFDYEEVSRQINAELPSGYQVAQMHQIDGFRSPSTSSIFVIARGADPANLTNFGDVFMIFDKNRDGYKRSYTFQAKGSTSEFNSESGKFVAPTEKVVARDLNGDGRNEIITAAADAPELRRSAPIIFTSQGNEVIKVSLPAEGSQAVPSGAYRYAMKGRTLSVLYLPQTICQNCTLSSHYLAVSYGFNGKQLVRTEARELEGVAAYESYLAAESYDK